MKVAACLVNPGFPTPPSESCQMQRTASDQNVRSGSNSLTKLQKVFTKAKIT